MLQHNVLTHTIQEGTVSRRMNRYYQVCSNEFGWSRAHPMKNKGDMHETLHILFKRYGVSPKMGVDGSKDKTFG